jgi:hypothetical protein
MPFITNPATLFEKICFRVRILANCCTLHVSLTQWLRLVIKRHEHYILHLLTEIGQCCPSRFTSKSRVLCPFINTKDYRQVVNLSLK